MMIGLGFLIWKLSAMPADLNGMADSLAQLGVKWLSIKVAEGSLAFNQDGGSDKKLLEFMAIMQGHEIAVGGWHYVYSTNPGPCGDRGLERYEKLKTLDHYLIDAEAGWSEPYGMPAAAKLLMSKLHNGGFDVGLCSYRYPSNFPNFPFSAFLNHEKNDFVAPQMYWEAAHNPVEQLMKCWGEYKGLTDKPFIPIGSSYGAGDWEATTEDILAFAEACYLNRFPAYGFYSLDYIIKHMKLDWLKAAARYSDPLPPPPPPPPVGLQFRVDVPVLNVRNGPGINSKDIGDLHAGNIVTALNVAGPDAWIEFEPGKWCCVSKGSAIHLKKV
jgi:hypothetical protein